MSEDKLLTKGLPSDPDAEEIVIGATLLDSRWLDNRSLRPHEMYLKSHQIISAEIVRMWSQGLPIEFPSLLSRLRDRGELEAAGGAAYIGSLIDGVPASDPSYYAGRISSKYLQRQCLYAGQAIQNHSVDCESGEEALEYAEQLIFEVLKEREQPGSREAVSLAEAADQYLETLEQRDTTKALTTGLVDLDRCIVGLEPESLTIVAARPSNGKSAFGVHIALNLAQQGIASAFYSLEMTRQQIVERMIANLAQIDLQVLRRGNLSREDWARVHDARQTVDRLPVYIDDTRGLNANQVCSRMRRLKVKHGIAMAIVDYLTRLRFERRRELRHELGDAAKMFKDISGELQIPVVAMSQLSRASVSDGRARRPQLSDLRESGNLEEDADTVILVHREWMYAPTVENKNEAELIVAKQRQGPAPEVIKVGFQGECVRFHNLWRAK